MILLKLIIMWNNISKYFIKGLITLLPLFITIWLISFLFNAVDGILGMYIEFFFGKKVPGLGLIATVLLIYMTGFFTHYILGEKVFLWMESIVIKVPIVKSIYSSAKQINGVLFQSSETKSYNRACLVEYPRKGIWSMGFITTYAAQEIQDKIKEERVMSIFIPNTPTPATGFLIMAPAKDVIVLDMKTEDAFKLIVSGGVLKPAEKAVS